MRILYFTLLLNKKIYKKFIQKKIYKFFILHNNYNNDKLYFNKYSDINFINNYYIFFYKFFKKESYTAGYWLTNFLNIFLKNELKLLIHWQFVNLNLLNLKKEIIGLWKLTYTKYFLQIFYCSAWYYFYILIQFIFFKNLKPFTIYITKILKKLELKHHKKIFQLIGFIFKSYLSYLSNFNKLKGYRIYFKGKLGRKGSVKKSIIYYSGGKISFTTKSLKYNYKYFTVPTETGLIGCYIGIFFNKMFTYIYIYLIFYFMCYLYLLIYFLTLLNIKNIEHMYLVYLLNILKKYTKYNPVIFILFFLTGLPPVSLFLIKFNFLITTYYTTSILIQFIIFINILMTMFFYLQIFNTTNVKFLLKKNTVNLLKNNKVLINSLSNNSFQKYYFYLSCCYFFFFNIFFIFFFLDLFLILFNYNL